MTQRDAKLNALSNQELLGGISQGLAHDFNTLITPLRTYFELLDEDADAALELRDFAAQNIRMLSELINEARIYTVSKSLITTSCRLEVVLDSVIKSLSNLMSQGHITVDRVGTANAAIEANRFLLRRLLGNLIINSIECGASHIQVSASEVRDGDSRWRRISITDDGPGIEEAHIQRIFEPYFSTKGGSGLGLAISEKIAEIHGGRICCESARTGSCTFSVFIPVAPQGA